MGWLVPLMVFDLVFLPMFHLFGLPVKLSYLLVVLLFLHYGTLTPGAFRQLRGEMVALFALLAVVTLIGSATFVLAFDGKSFSDSARSIIIYLLAPMAFVVGSFDSRRSHAYVIPYIFLYAVATILFSIFFQELDWMVRFYSLEEGIEAGTYVYRSQGLYQNAGISALFMTILFLYFTVGAKHGLVRESSLRGAVVVGAVFATVVALLSRDQLMAVSLLAILYVIWALQSRRKGTLIAAAVAGAALVLVVVVVQISLPYNPISELGRLFSSIGDTSEPSESYVRPIQRWGWASARWIASPLVGTGFDHTGAVPFEGTLYHNDWFYVLTASGVVGLIILTAIVVRLASVDVMLAVPFFLPGMTNSFIFAPSHLVLYMLLAGLVWRRKTMGARSSGWSTVAGPDVSPDRSHSYAG